MNKSILCGRIVRDPEIKNNGTMVARYTLACDRRIKRDGEPTADFINIVAFGKSAEFIEKYCKKGTKLIVSGRIQTGSYTNKDGVRVNTFDIIADEQEFAESKGAAPTQAEPIADESFIPVDEDDLEDTPF